MSTKNNSISVIEKQEVAIPLYSPSNDIVERFKARKTDEGKFLLFDDYRYGLGGRGIWGTKIFYRAMEEMNILARCNRSKSTSSSYCPTEEALDKYPNMFLIKEESNMWGFSLEYKHEIDELIFPTLIKVARVLDDIFKEEKLDKQRASYAKKKAMEKAKRKINISELV